MRKLMKQRLRVLALMLCATLCMGLTSSAAYAAPAIPPSTAAAQTCTSFADSYLAAADTSTPGILSNITTYIKTVVGTASETLFEAFTGSTAFQNSVYAAMVLMVTLYGVGFLIGIVQASFAQVLTRLIKIGIIFAVIQPGNWAWVNSYVGTFFNDGSDQIIGKVISIGTGTTYVAADGPFRQLDGLGKIILTPNMVIGVMGAVLNSGPYGLMMGGLLGTAMMGLIKLFIEGLRIYATSFVVRSLLIGVLPIFIVFLLFERTKQMFSSWVNVMVNLVLQPILYFTFISFFLVMLTTSATNMMGGHELCWTEFKASAGTQNKMSFWRFKDSAGSTNVDEFTWQGSLSCYLNGGTDASTGKPCAGFPVNIVDVLSFLILIYVATKFGGVVEQISTEISNSFVSLNTAEKMSFDSSKNADGAKSSNDPNPGASAQVKNTAAAQTGQRSKGAGK